MESENVRDFAQGIELVMAALEKLLPNGYKFAIVGYKGDGTGEGVCLVQTDDSTHEEIIAAINVAVSDPQAQAMNLEDVIHGGH